MLQHDETTTVRVVRATKNYAQFHYDKRNRPIDQRKTYRMRRSMVDIDEETGEERVTRNWLPNYPIVVTEDGKVLDGQHRLEVARGLGLEIHFIIADDMTIRDVGVAQHNTDKWSSQDFLHFYAADGDHNYESYEWLAFFLDQWDHVSLASCLSVIREGNEPIYETLRNGRMEISQEQRDLLGDMALLSLRLREFVPVLYKTATFQQAVRHMLSHHKFSAERLVTQFENTALTVYRKATMYEYVDALAVVYNYNKSASRVDFKDGQW